MRTFGKDAVQQDDEGAVADSLEGDAHPPTSISSKVGSFTAGPGSP